MLALRLGVEEIEETHSPEAKPLHIGALPTVSARLLPKAIQRYIDRKIGGRPVIVTGPNNYLINQLRDGRVDIVIGRMGEPSEMI